MTPGTLCAGAADAVAKGSARTGPRTSPDHVRRSIPEPQPHTLPQGAAADAASAMDFRGIADAGFGAVSHFPGGATHMRKKILVVGLVVAASTGGAWAAGGRMSVEETARYVLERARM